MRKFLFFFNPFIILFSLNVIGFSQEAKPQPTPPDSDINITTEEIKLNISAVTSSGSNAIELTSEDVVINENGRLHQATSIRKIPANVLILLDVGNEISYAKRSRTTAETARSLVNYLQIDDSIAVIQYGDKVEVLSDWTKDKATLNKILAVNKLGFGKYSRFNLAMQMAVDYFDKTPLENRHLILISDGIDSLNNPKTKADFTNRLLSSDINVHVISYTFLQTQSIAGNKVKKATVPRISPIPPGAGLPEYQKLPVGGSVSVNLDREMQRHRKKEMNRLLRSEKFLTELAKDTNGMMLIPATLEEMPEKMGDLAKYIDSQYVVTYTPNKPLAESPDGEVRNISVTSKKSGVYIQSRRRYVVLKKKGN